MLQDISTPTLRQGSIRVLETERLMLRAPTLADVKSNGRASPTTAALPRIPAAFRIPIRRTTPCEFITRDRRRSAARPCS